MYLHIPTAMTFWIFMDEHYYLMDVFFSLYIFMVSGMAIFAYFCSQNLPCVRCSGFLWPTHFAWMTAARRDFRLRDGTRQNASCLCV